MGVEKPALPEKPAFKLTDVVSDMLIKKVLEQSDHDGISFGESANAASPLGSPKVGRRGGLMLPEASRSRSGSTASAIVDDVELKRLESELFNHCKVADTDPKANSGILLRELEKMGILRTDPRLDPMIDTLKMIKRKTFGAIYGIDNIKLDFNQFQKVIKPSIVIIVKAFKGQLVIPEFDAFTKDIQEIFETCRSNRTGKPADYIPQLARGDPNKWGVSLCTTDGQRYSIGDYQDHFSIQSTSKPFTYALALNHMGAEVVQKYIGREPSGRTFNEIALDYNGQPHNPMVNSGAIMSSALLLYMVKPELTVSEKFEYVHAFFSKMSGGHDVGFQNSTFLSERDTADRNNALAYFMRESGCFPNGPNNAGGGVDIKNILDFYFQTCSLEMNCESMSVMAGTLANGGICPITGERVLANEAVKNVLSLMYSCGMYNYSGQFAFQVGLPAKSGVSGIVLVVVPNVVGFATWSPPLDGIGNSARGVMFAEELVKVYNFHTFDSIGEHTSEKKNPKVQNYEEQSLKLVQLLFASSQGDKMALERAYLAGVDMGMGDYDCRTALHLACAENHPACVKYLIETCNVPLDAEDRWGNTPLQDAVRCNHPRIVAMVKKFMSQKGYLAEPIIREDEEEDEKAPAAVRTVTVNVGGPGDISMEDPTTEMAAMKIQNAFRKNKERKESKRANGSTTVISM